MHGERSDHYLIDKIKPHNSGAFYYLLRLGASFTRINVECIGPYRSIMVPLHHKLEKWATNKLIEKNKAIRLANAKKTIAQLEEKDN